MYYEHSYSMNTFLTFDVFESDSAVCVIEKYELLQAQYVNTEVSDPLNVAEDVETTEFNNHP